MLFKLIQNKRKFKIMNSPVKKLILEMEMVKWNEISEYDGRGISVSTSADCITNLLENFRLSVLRHRLHFTGMQLGSLSEEDNCTKIDSEDVRKENIRIKLFSTGHRNHRSWRNTISSDKERGSVALHGERTKNPIRSSYCQYRLWQILLFSYNDVKLLNILTLLYCYGQLNSLYRCIA